MVVIKRRFPIRPKKIKTNANIAPINVARSVGRDDVEFDNVVWYCMVELIVDNSALDGTTLISFIVIISEKKKKNNEEDEESKR